MIELAARSRLGEAGESSRSELRQPTQATPCVAGSRGANDPHRARAGRRRSRGVPAAPPGCPEVPERGCRLTGRSGAAAAPLCLCTSGASERASAASGSSCGRSLTRARAAAPPSPLSFPPHSLAGGSSGEERIPPALNHTESSRSRLAALSALPSPARSARTSFSWTNLVKQAGIYEWKGDQAQRGERCF